MSFLKSNLPFAGILAVLIVLFVAIHQDLQSNRLEQTHVLGEKQSHRVVLYLNGMDLPSPSSQERTNRKKLDHIGRELSIKFLLPRATGSCPQDPQKICWPQETEKDVALSLKEAIASLPLEDGRQDRGLRWFLKRGILRE